MEQYDFAVIALYLFWIFFAGLIFYLQRESQREGYPVEVDNKPGSFRSSPLLFYPSPKTFHLPDGSTRSVPDGVPDRRAIAGSRTSRLPGAPIEPSNANPLADGVGPGAWAERSEKPDMTTHGTPRIVPMRVATDYTTSSRDPDPRGATVIGCDGKAGGKVVDIWVDRSECLARYMEVETNATTGHRVLLPMTFAVVKTSPTRVIVSAITGAQFAGVPTIAKADSVSLREEDRICGYYGAGTLYATPDRAEPLL